MYIAKGDFIRICSFMKERCWVQQKRSLTHLYHVLYPFLEKPKDWDFGSWSLAWGSWKRTRIVKGLPNSWPTSMPVFGWHSQQVLHEKLFTTEQNEKYVWSFSSSWYVLWSLGLLFTGILEGFNRLSAPSVSSSRKEIWRLWGRTIFSCFWSQRSSSWLQMLSS